VRESASKPTILAQASQKSYAIVRFDWTTRAGEVDCCFEREYISPKRDPLA